ncbi:hypothetical protein CY34DRAFT_10735 [Suillus luteus UH-Slu-Lm8-n1]|uniref:Uncharacterized protein n=1 Tax=Suillus luteus UH-Slu-Lm8-n1 TaxID=930992 RepID=A0A0D0BFG1_9AGAM|nr:hypothetical protein CY34DRAFT_10735 [Suillus luteus UH-Slu-Lm8-n1]
MRSTNNDCVASQPTSMKQTAAQAHTIYCVRAGGPVVVVHGVGTDWRTVSCLVNDHVLVSKGGLRGSANAPPRSGAHSTQITPRPPHPAPASCGVQGGNGDNCDKATTGRRKKYKKEPQRKQELEDDEYAEDVKPKSVKCRGCQHTIKLDDRSMYYPELWIRHRKRCRAIRKMEADKRLDREREWGFQSNIEQHLPAAASFDASGEDSDKEADKEVDEYEYQPRHIMGFSTSYVRGDWEGGKR